MGMVPPVATRWMWERSGLGVLVNFALTVPAWYDFASYRSWWYYTLGWLIQLTEPGKDSPYRNRSAEENLDLFERMRAGEFEDGSRTLRAKIDMASRNINLRDPVMYRILHATHHRTGDKWCIYPMYDFAHDTWAKIEKAQKRQKRG
jgi:hypothetical protein